MKYLRLLLWLVALPLSAAAAWASSGEPVVFEHRLGSATIAGPPQRVAVMDYGTLDTIDALGLDLTLAVPKANLPPYLNAFDRDAVVDLGGVREFNIEKIAAFKPDLIVISGRQQDHYAELSEIAPTILIEIDYPNYWSSVVRNFERLGAVFGVSDQMKDQIASLDKHIKQIAEKAGGGDRRALVILTNDGRISAYGSGSRFGLIHDVFGVKAADQTIKPGLHGQQINFEYIARTNPDVLFVVDRSVVVGGKANGLTMLDNALVKRTNASKNGRIVSLDPGVWYLSGGGLQSMRMMADEIEKALD